jgi:hypothetical protein
LKGSLRKFRELKAASTKEIEEPEQIEVNPRHLEPRTLGELPLEFPADGD